MFHAKNRGMTIVRRGGAGHHVGPDRCSSRCFKRRVDRGVREVLIDQRRRKCEWYPCSIDRHRSRVEHSQAAKLEHEFLKANPEDGGLLKNCRADALA